jgi:hypothetical protein
VSRISDKSESDFSLLFCIFVPKTTAMRTLQITGDSPGKRRSVDEKRAKTSPSEEEIRPMTMAEYNAMIDEAVAAQRAGEYISQEDLEKEILTWK